MRRQKAKRACATAGQVRPGSGCRSGSRTLGRVCAQSIARKVADCRSARRPASPLDARGAGQAGCQEEAAARGDSRLLCKLERSMIAASRRGVAGSILPVIYGNGLEIVQTPGYVAIRYEMVHDVRIIPTDGRAHLKFQHPLLYGRRCGPLGRQHAGGGDHQSSGDTLGSRRQWRRRSLQRRHEAHRTVHARGPNTINYELTVNDPKTYTAPWTGRVSDHAGARIQALRVCLPRRKHGHAQHAERGAHGRRESRRRKEVIRKKRSNLMKTNF